MKLSPATLRVVAEIITGDPKEGTDPSPRWTLGRITDFFRAFGERDLHPSSGAPSRFTYALGKVEKFNGTDDIGRVICAALDFWDEAPQCDPVKVAARLNGSLRRDGYELTLEHRGTRMEGDEAVPYGEHFQVRALGLSMVPVPTLAKATEGSVHEHVTKARQRMDAGDLTGAITIAYTLVEAVLKDLCQLLGVVHGSNEGDIRALYRTLREPLHLNPAADGLVPALKPILTGLSSMVDGLFEVANKVGDRHVDPNGPRPSGRHARLAVNAAFTLCDFLVASHHDQAARAAAKKNS